MSVNLYKCVSGWSWLRPGLVPGSPGLVLALAMVPVGPGFVRDWLSTSGYRWSRLRLGMVPGMAWGLNGPGWLRPRHWSWLVLFGLGFVLVWSRVSRVPAVALVPVGPGWPRLRSGLVPGMASVPGWSRPWPWSRLAPFGPGFVPVLSRVWPRSRVGPGRGFGPGWSRLVPASSRFGPGYGLGSGLVTGGPGWFRLFQALLRSGPGYGLGHGWSWLVPASSRLVPGMVSVPGWSSVVPGGPGPRHHRSVVVVLDVSRFVPASWSQFWVVPAPSQLCPILAPVLASTLYFYYH